MIKDKTFGEERALYNLQNETLENCSFEGEEDGESALKESRNIMISDSEFHLRYPLWHVETFEVTDSLMTDTCRAPIWYCNNGIFNSSVLYGPKSLRECSDIKFNKCDINSVEFGWKCSDIEIIDSRVESEYIFLNSKNISFKNVEMTGKYSFQYVDNLSVENSKLDTKDAFWHSKNIVIKDSTLKGEYLAWFSENLTLINCHIVGTQPFCYCRNLKLVNCTMENCDFAFEKSTVEAEVKSHIDSIRRPLSGNITALSVGEILEDSSFDCKGNINICEK